MSLIDEMAKDKSKRITVNVEDVRVNDLNFYNFEEEVINRLAKSIEESGQLENAVVYEEVKDDNCIYTLIGGETRYRAICKLVEQEKSEGDFQVVVIDKPLNKTRELELIMEDNVQRHKGKKTIISEIENWENIYNSLVENGERPVGKKRDWIGDKLGLTGRTIDNLKKQNDETSTNPTTVVGHTREEVMKKLKANYKALCKILTMEEEVGMNDIHNDLLNLINDLKDIIGD